MFIIIALDYIYSLVPILREEYLSKSSVGASGNKDYYHSVAVIKKGTLPNVYSMQDLKGLKACFPKVGSKIEKKSRVFYLISPQSNHRSLHFNTNETFIFILQVGSLAGWTLPIHKLIANDVMRIEVRIQSNVIRINL